MKYSHITGKIKSFLKLIFRKTTPLIGTPIQLSNGSSPITECVGLGLILLPKNTLIFSSTKLSTTYAGKVLGRYIPLQKIFRNNSIREYKNRQQHNKVWLKKYLQYNEQRFDSNTDLLIKRITKYGLLVEKLNRPGIAFSLTLSMRVKIPQNLIRFSLKRFMFKISRLSKTNNPIF